MNITQEKDVFILLNELRNSLINNIDSDFVLSKLDEIEADLLKNSVKNKNLNATVIDLVPDLIFHKNLEGVYQDCNKAFELFVGFNKSDILGKTDYELFADQDLAQYFREKDKLVVSSLKSKRNEEWVVYPDGRKVLLDTLKTPVFSVQNEIVGVVGVSRNITDLNSIKDSIIEEKLFLRSVIDAIPDLIFFKDKDSRFIGGNKAFEAYLAQYSIEYVGKTDYEVLQCEKSSDLFKEKDHAVFSSNEPIINEEVLFNVDGTSFFVEIKKTPFYNFKGELLGLIGVARDVTERKSIGEELFKSKERLDLALNGANDGLWDWNIETNEIYFSPRWKAMLGYADEELKSSKDTIIDILHPDDVERVLKSLNALMAGQSERYELEYMMRAKDGSYKSLLSRGKIILGLNKKPVRLTGTHVDITERIESEGKIRRQAELLTEVQKLANLGIWQWDIPNNQVVWSSQLYKIYGITTQDFEASLEGYLTLVHEEDRERVRNIIYSSFEARSSFSVEERIVRPSGEVRVLQSWGTVMLDDAGEPVLMYGACIDITEQIEAKEAFFTAVFDGQEKERRRISQDLHDGLGQHLSGMKLSMYGLKSQIKNDYFNRITDLADQAIKEYRAVTHDLAPPALSNSGLKEALRDMCASLNRNNKTKVVFSSECADCKLKDKVEIELYRISQELLNNAIKYSNAKQINVKIKMINSHFQLEDRDDGDGFNLEEVKARNLGIGLENIKARVAFFNGIFSLDSSEGKGTFAKIILQLK